MESSLLSILVGNLVGAQKDSRTLSGQVESFLWTFRKAPKGVKASLPDAVFNVLADLAMDLEYYVHDPNARAEDPSYFGDEKALEKINSALVKLQNLGINLEL